MWQKIVQPLVHPQSELYLAVFVNCFLKTCYLNLLVFIYLFYLNNADLITLDAHF